MLPKMELVKHQHSTFHTPEGMIPTATIPSQEHSKALQVWHEGPWFGGEQGGAGFVVGLNDLRDLFQPKCSYDSM